MTSTTIDAVEQRRPIGGRADRAQPRAATSTKLIGALRPGAIIDVAARSYRGPRSMLVATAHRKGGASPDGRQQGGPGPATSPSTTSRTCRRCSVAIQLPGGFAPQRREWRNEVAKRLRQAKVRPAGGAAHRASPIGNASDQPSGRTDIHPVELDPDLRAKLRAAGEADRVAREIADTRAPGQRARTSRSVRISIGCSPCCRTYGYVERRRVGTHRGGRDAGQDVPRV